MACVTIRKRKLSHWCGQDTGSYGHITCVHRKILQFPAVTAATVSQIISYYQNHLKVIPRHSHWPGTVLLYRTVNGSNSYTHTKFLCTETHTFIVSANVACTQAAAFTCSITITNLRSLHLVLVLQSDIYKKKSSAQLLSFKGIVKHFRKLCFLDYKKIDTTLLLEEGVNVCWFWEVTEIVGH